MQPKPDHRRVFPRYKAFIATRAQRDGEEIRTHILDVARGGARIHTDRRLAVHDRAVIRLGDRDLKGTVVWTRDTKAGFRFDTALSPSEIVRIITL